MVCCAAHFCYRASARLHFPRPSVAVRALVTGRAASRGGASQPPPPTRRLHDPGQAKMEDENTKDVAAAPEADVADDDVEDDTPDVDAIARARAAAARARIGTTAEIAAKMWESVMERLRSVSRSSLMGLYFRSTYYFGGKDLVAEGCNIADLMPLVEELSDEDKRKVWDAVTAGAVWSRATALAREDTEDGRRVDPRKLVTSVRDAVADSA